jgi:imidazole glycerol-phosphate synthase subunit HisH
VTDVVVVPTGTANIASVLTALRRVGADPRHATTPSDVADAVGVVLPGVGTFGAAMGAVEASGLRAALRSRLSAGRATLAVCVGMQLLCEASVESPDAAGLGVVPATVRRFEGAPRVPQLGWNRVEPSPGSRFVEPGWAYFANSYRIESVPDGWVVSSSDYGGSFVAAMERGAVLACQFHPELSGDWGSALLRRWLEASEEAP